MADVICDEVMQAHPCLLMSVNSKRPWSVISESSPTISSHSFWWQADFNQRLIAGVRCESGCDLTYTMRAIFILKVRYIKSSPDWLDDSHAEGSWAGLRLELLQSPDCSGDCKSESWVDLRRWEWRFKPTSARQRGDVNSYPLFSNYLAVTLNKSSS